MTKAEQRAEAMAAWARRRDGLEVTVEVEHRDPTYFTSGGEERLLSDGQTIATLTVRETAWYSHSAIYASWSTGDGLGDHRRTTRFHCRLYHGSPSSSGQLRGKRISERTCATWLGILGTARTAEG